MDGSQKQSESKNRAVQLGQLCCQRFFVDLRTDSLKRSQMKEWLYQLQYKPAMIQKGESHVAANHPISQQTQTHAFKLLQKCLKDAVDEGFISAHPAHDLKVAKQFKATQGWTFLRSDEIQALLESEKIPEPARAIYQIAIYRGRRGNKGRKG